MRLHALSVLTLAVSLTACGGGSATDLMQSGFGAVRVEGLTYTTASKRGVTGPGGSFDYEPGEAIEFRIGDTVLGSASAREFLTTADLISGFVVPRTNAEFSYVALSEKRHVGVRWLNMLVFLQALDADGDSTNGIQIPSEAAALLAGVQLEFNQPPGQFNQYIPVRTFLRDGAAAGLWGGVAPVLREPFKAASAYYAGSGIETRFEAVVQLTSDVDADGVIDRDSIVSYFGEERVSFSDDDDADGVSDRTTTIELDAYGRLADSESKDSAGTVVNKTIYEFDAAGNLYRTTQYDGALVDRRTTFSHDDLGLLRREERDSNGAGTVDRITMYDYDAVGRRIRTDRDADADGTIDFIVHFRYDANGYTRLREEDTNADGTIDRRRTYVTDPQGRRTLNAYDENADGVVDDRTRTAYDDAARTSREEREEDGVPTRIKVSSYDELGRIVREERDEGADGAVDRISIATYAADRTVHEQDTDADGTIDRREVHEITPGGNITRVLIDDDADGTYDRIEDIRWTPSGFFQAILFGGDA